MPERIYLSPPSVTDLEKKAVLEAVESGWIAPAGPAINAFENAFAKKIGTGGAVAMASGTAALHIALRLAGVQKGDTVLCSNLTFIASANPITYMGAKPIFIDSETQSWNMDAALLEDFLSHCAEPPKALVLAHILGQCADTDAIQNLCQKYGITLIEDAAEALGATYKGKAPASDAQFAIFSFNGNKMVTTSGGGMFVSHDATLLDKARYLSTQAREPGLDYIHNEIGYNYRMSNICAAIGLAQLQRLEKKVAARRAIFSRYQEAIPLEWMPEAPWGTHSRWLSCGLCKDQRQRDTLLDALTKANIEARPVWRPMNKQPVFSGCEIIGGSVSEELWQRGICLPSGDNLSIEDQQRVIEAASPPLHFL